jgi:hypothetical protein
MIDRGIKAEAKLRELQAREEAEQLKETGKATNTAQKMEVRAHKKQAEKQQKISNVKKDNHHIQQPSKKSS